MIATGICILSPVPPAGRCVYRKRIFNRYHAGNYYCCSPESEQEYLIIAGVRWASMQKLLKEGEYTPQEIRKSYIKETIATAYWLSATAIYLAWSFLTNAWETTWIVWPVAGVLFAGVMAICRLFTDKKD